MFSKLRNLGAAAIVGLLIATACGDDKVSPGKTSGASGEAGADGATAGSHAGSPTKGGSSTGGTAGKPGIVGKAGSSTAAGAGGEGGVPACPGCQSGLCLEDGTCVDCLASNDQCPQGEYCTDANECASGCKADGSSCISGVCSDDHNCQNCLSDDECGAGNVCGNGECAPACTEEGAPAGCSESLICCSERCTDLATDRNHCGACGAACDSGQFCGLDLDGSGGAGGAGAGSAVSCKATVLANLCGINKVVLIHDTSKNPDDGDRLPGEAIGAALVAQCPSAPTLTAVDQSDADALNFTTGRPVSGGRELIVFAGGPVFQAIEGYLEENRISPLYFKSDGTTSGYFKSSDDLPVLSQPVAGDHESEDQFIVQFSNDPASGSLVLNAQGMWLSGTVAASFVVTNQILPDLASYDEAWYAYKWSDLDGDKAPSLDEITLIDHGN